MKGAIYLGPKNVEIKELPMPDCDDNGIVIKNIYASICGSDVFAWNYDGSSNMIFPGLEYGHEMVGEVIKVGKNVQGVELGDRLFPVPAYAKGDMMRAATVGGFSEYVELKNCVLNQTVYKISDKISSKVASLIEPFTVGCNAVQRIGNIEAGKGAVVFGAGPIGLASAVTLKYLGCRVVVVDLMENRLKIAEELGMLTCNLSTDNYLEKCGELLGTIPGMMGGTSIDADYYVDAAGNQAVIDSFCAGAKAFSSLSVVAIHHKPVTLNLVGLTYNGLRIIGPCGGFGDDVRLVLEIFESGQFDIEKMITHVFPHDQFIEALEQANKAAEALKVVIEY